MKFEIPSSLDGLDALGSTASDAGRGGVRRPPRRPGAGREGLTRLSELDALVQTGRTEQANIEQIASELHGQTAMLNGPEEGDGDGEPGDGGEIEETPAESEQQQQQPAPVVASLAAGENYVPPLPLIVPSRGPSVARPGMTSCPVVRMIRGVLSPGRVASVDR